MPGAAPLFAGAAVLVPAEVFAVVEFALVAGCVPALAAFFVPVCAALPDLLAAVGVGEGVGVGVVWLWAPEFCAVAIVAMAIASARICISFISIPFCALFIQFTYFAGAAGVAGCPALAGAGAGCASGSWLKKVVATQLASTVSPGA